MKKETFHKRKESLPNLGHQQFLQKLFDTKGASSVKRPELSNYRKEHEMYLNNEQKSRNKATEREAFNQTTIGGGRMLAHDASIQGIE